MKNAEAWVKILYTYGPFAILVLLVFVMEVRSRKAMNEAAKGENKNLILYRVVYSLNWVLIVCAVIYSVMAWKQINLDRKPTITGTVVDLSNSEILSTSFDDLYLHRIRQDNDLYSNYEWLLVNKEKRFDDGDTIVFTIDRSKPNSESTYDYELPIRSEFYDKKVHLRRDKDDLYLAGQDNPLRKRSKLIGAPANATARRDSPSGFFVTTAYAQDRNQAAQMYFSVDNFAVGLESPDAIVRRKTRADLANQDQATALPWIDKVLQDEKSSYRLKLGVIVALNNMPNLRGESLRPAIIAAIQSALGEDDESLRNEAFSLAKKYNLVPVTLYEDTDNSGRSQGFGPGKYLADRGQLGYLPNDSASSVRVAPGFRVRLCDNEDGGIGGGNCEEKGEGSHQLRLAVFGGVADRVSYIEVVAIKNAATRMKK